MRRIGVAVVLAVSLILAPLAAVAQQKAMPVMLAPMPSQSATGSVERTGGRRRFRT